MNRPTLLLLHAFGASGASWNAFRTAWDGPTLAPDIPGFAGSAPPPGALSVAACADWVLARLAEAEAPTVLVGWSMGGKLAAAAAARQPEGLRALVLLAPSPPVPEPIEEEERGRQLRSLGAREGAEANADDNAAHRLPDSAREAAIADWLAVDKKAWRWWWLEGSRETVDVSAVDVPVTVLAGERDPNLGPDVQRRLTLPAFAGAELHTLPDVGHLIPREAPDELARVMAQRLDGVG